MITRSCGGEIGYSNPDDDAHDGWLLVRGEVDVCLCDDEQLTRLSVTTRLPAMSLDPARS